MPVQAWSFYPNNEDTNDSEESESRWGRRKYVSDVVIAPSVSAPSQPPLSEPPPSNTSSPALSAPSSGFSPPKGSVNTEPSSTTKMKHTKLFSFPNLLKPTRFATAIGKQPSTPTGKLPQTSQHAVELLTQLQRRNDFKLPASNTTEKCDVWMSGCEYSKVNMNTERPLVDYSPSSNSSLPSCKSAMTPLKRRMGKENADESLPPPAKRLFDTSGIVSARLTAADGRSPPRSSTESHNECTSAYSPQTSSSSQSSLLFSSKPSAPQLVQDSLCRKTAAIMGARNSKPILLKSQPKSQFSAKPVQSVQSSSSRQIAFKAAIAKAKNSALEPPNSKPHLSQSSGKKPPSFKSSLNSQTTLNKSATNSSRSSKPSSQPAVKPIPDKKSLSSASVETCSNLLHLSKPQGESAPPVKSSSSENAPPVKSLSSKKAVVVGTSKNLLDSSELSSQQQGKPTLHPLSPASSLSSMKQSSDGSSEKSLGSRKTPCSIIEPPVNSIGSVKIPLCELNVASGSSGPTSTPLGVFHLSKPRGESAPPVKSSSSENAPPVKSLSSKKAVVVGTSKNLLDSSELSSQQQGKPTLHPLSPASSLSSMKQSSDGSSEKSLGSRKTPCSITQPPVNSIGSVKIPLCELNVASGSSGPTSTPLGLTLRSRESHKPVYADSDSEEDLFGGVISDSDEDFVPNAEQFRAEEMHRISSSDDSSENESNIEDNIEDSVERGPGDHDLDIEEENANKSTSRKIKSNNKQLRNSGQQYVTPTGKNIAARQRRQVHHCSRRKCHLIITDEVADSLFSEYWSQGNYDKRVSYVASRIEYETIKRSRRRDCDSNRSKSVSYKYFFEFEGVRHQVCKSTFLDVLGETDCFLRNCAAKKEKSVSGITPDDRRGRKTPSHAFSSETKDLIESHIKSFPAYVSHYCRSQTKQKYLSNSLNVQIMFDLFKSENPTEKVSYSSYYRKFITMKLKFKPPASDTCGTCDEFLMLIKSTQSEEEKQKHQARYDLHLRRAEAAYALKRRIKELAQEDDSVRVLIFDLEQVLATPLVPTGKAFYLRQLNTYNLTVVDCKSDKTHCYMWHECEAARGANEIASSLFAHMLDAVPDTVKTVYLFSDCCSGQNRNSIVSAMHHVVLQLHSSLRTIHHIFLVPGHTRMECDSMHSVIERSKSKTTVVAVPEEWYALVRGAGKQGSFHVTEMKDIFFDFQHLLSTAGPLLKREKKDNGDKMYWTQTHWYQYKKSAPGIVCVKSSFNVDAPTDSYNMIRGNGKNRKLKGNWYLDLPKCNGKNAISELKKKNLLTLLNYIDPVHHSFYQNLPTDPNLLEDTDPDLPEELPSED